MEIPLKSSIFLILSKDEFVPTTSPTLKEPSVKSKVAVGPLKLSRYDSTTTPSPGFSESVFNSSISDTNKINSKISGMPFLVLAEISSEGIFPPKDSTKNPSFCNSLFTFSGLASGLSILFKAIITGIWTSLILEITSLV